MEKRATEKGVRHFLAKKCQAPFSYGVGVFLAGALCLLCAPTRAYSAAPSSDIVIPSDLGYVVETHAPASPDEPLIVHIQEAHANLEGQRHLISILEQLIAQRHLKLILVEGGHGNVGLAYLRDFGSLETRKEVAEKYLALGILSGEEYLDMVSDHPLILWGVEQDDLYQQNVKAFLDVEPLQAAALPVLVALREAVDELKPVVSDPALLELEAKRAAFEQEQLGLAAYGQFLDGLAQRQGLSADESPQLKRFLEVHRLEQDLRLEQVQQEQRAVLEQLSATLKPADFDELIAQARQMKAKTLRPEAFYASLQARATASQIDLSSAAPTLARYIRYITQSARVAPAILSDELEQLAARLRKQLTSSIESQKLSAIAEQVELVRKLVDLELSPEEYKTFQSLAMDGLCDGWARGLNGLLAQHGLPRRPFDQLAGLQAMLPAVQRFYSAANDRDQALVDNTLAKIRDSGERIAVLITGGFHAPRLSKLLEEQGAGLVVVTPKVTQATNEALYHAVLKYKSGHGSFEDVVAAAANKPSLRAATH